MVELVPEVALLTVLAGLIFALGCMKVLHVFVSSLFIIGNSVVTKLPFGIGKRLFGDSLLAIEHRINSAMTGAVAAIEHDVSQTWRAMTRLAEMTAAAIEQTAEAVYRVGKYVEVTFPLHVLSASVHRLERLVAHLPNVGAVTVQRIKHVTIHVDYPARGKVGAALRAAVRPLQTELSRFERRTTARLHALEHTAAGSLAGELDGLRAGQDALERSYRRLRDLLKRNPATVGALAFTAAVSFALARLGAGWIRCTKVGKAGRAVCGLDPDLLDALLLEGLTIAGALSIVTFAKACHSVEDVVVGQITYGIPEIRKIGG